MLETFNMKETSEGRSKKSLNSDLESALQRTCLVTVLLSGYADSEAKVMKIDPDKRRHDFPQHKDNLYSLFERLIISYQVVADTNKSHCVPS